MSEVSPPEFLAALTNHGVFLKKAVAEALRSQSTFVIEEFATVFSSPGVLDLVARLESGTPPKIESHFLCIECKRAYLKAWVFVETHRRSYRYTWKIDTQGCHDEIAAIALDDVVVCSEGFEITRVNGVVKADPDPIFKAGQQLANSYLGFVTYMWRRSERRPRKSDYSFCPLLVTNAPLYVQTLDKDQLCLKSGRAGIQAEPRKVDWLVLKQPLAKANGNDFREELAHANQAPNDTLITQESLYVVNSEYLLEFVQKRKWALPLDLL